MSLGEKNWTPKFASKSPNQIPVKVIERQCLIPYRNTLIKVQLLRRWRGLMSRLEYLHLRHPRTERRELLLTPDMAASTHHEGVALQRLRDLYTEDQGAADRATSFHSAPWALPRGKKKNEPFIVVMRLTATRRAASAACATSTSAPTFPVVNVPSEDFGRCPDRYRVSADLLCST